MPTINDIIETDQQAPQFMWWEIALYVLLAAIVLGVLISLVSKRHKKAQTKLSLIDSALSQLDSLDTSSTDSNRIAVHLSLIIRQYLQSKFNNQVLFETDEEFHEHSTELDKLPAETVEQLQSYMQDVSKHKYSPNSDDQDALAGLVSKASALLVQIDLTPRSN